MVRLLLPIFQHCGQTAPSTGHRRVRVNSWIKKTKDKKGFEYSLKVLQLVSNKALVEGDKERAIFWANLFEKTCVRPLADAGLLGGMLFQLSPYFKNEGSSLDNLNNILDAVSYRDFDYAVEFRHRSWLDESKKEMDAANLEALKDRNVANVLIDGPGLRVGTEQTAGSRLSPIPRPKLRYLIQG